MVLICEVIVVRNRSSIVVLSGCHVLVSSTVPIYAQFLFFFVNDAMRCDAMRCAYENVFLCKQLLGVEYTN
jgi:hypothetical protein